MRALPLRKAIVTPRRRHPLSVCSIGALRHFQSGASETYKFNPEGLSTQPKAGDAYDITIVGGGIIGCATGMTLSKTFPHLKMALLEKESLLAQHQSGHNSGVIHAGVYYKPGSLKAKLCVEGLRLSYDYFDKNGIPYRKCGKLIVAVRPDEIPRLEDLYERGLKNNVPGLKLVDGQQIKQYEPNCVGLKAIFSPETGIVDYTKVTRSYAFHFIQNGGKLHTDFNVKKFQKAGKGQEEEYPVQIFNDKGKFIRTKYVLTCGGLESDRISEMSGGSPNPKIIPFRGEYLVLSKEKAKLIRGNIYPVPDPRFPFLGVHFTPRMDGSVWLGPNAVLAFKREGYKWKDFDSKDFLDSVRYPGFQKLALKYVTFGLGEIIRSKFINLQMGKLQEYVPNICASDVKRGPAGVRAQAMDEDGNLVDDFVFDSGKGELSERVLHVRNAPSPAATSSLAIANMICQKVKSKFNLETFKSLENKV